MYAQGSVILLLLLASPQAGPFPNSSTCSSFSFTPLFNIVDPGPPSGPLGPEILYRLPPLHLSSRQALLGLECMSSWKKLAVTLQPQNCYWTFACPPPQYVRKKKNSVTEGLCVNNSICSTGTSFSEVVGEREGHVQFCMSDWE